MSLARLRLYLINVFIAAVLVGMAIEALPSPLGLQLLVRPLLIRLGIDQGRWGVFAPDPDRTNTRLRAEITYRDGQRRDWKSPDWRAKSPWEMFVTHRRREWLDHMISQQAGPAWEPWCRHLARAARPEMPQADRGATVRLIYREAPVPPAESKPWPTIHAPVKYDDGWVLSIEKLE